MIWGVWGHKEEGLGGGLGLKRVASAPACAASAPSHSPDPTEKDKPCVWFFPFLAG